ncbi:MAG: HAMP domain-containing sensor histidine kinase [Candidatus Eremiobacterota bacterium]
MDTEIKTRDEEIKIDDINSLEIFSGVIAHEFNNLLSGIQAWAQIGEKEQDIKNIKKAFKSINEACQKGTTLAKSLLSFSRTQELDLEYVDVNDLLDETINLITIQLDKKLITVERNYSTLPDLLIDKGKIYQVFLNILINARDAIKKQGGIIKISTSMREENIVEISFSDNGKGISKESLRNIFKPFYTTKIHRTRSGSLGTGLGLAISRDIIRQHKGEIMVESIEGKGTTFYILLPVEGPKKI